MPKLTDVPDPLAIGNGSAYSTGSVELNNGSATVTGSGTTWTGGNAAAGHIIEINGVPYLISSVVGGGADAAGVNAGRGRAVG